LRFQLGAPQKDPVVVENEGEVISQIFIARKGEKRTTYTENKGSTIINKSRYDHYSFPLSPMHSTNVKTRIFGGNKALFYCLI